MDKALPILGKNPIFIFGAGATKACGGPLTAEILPAAFRPPLSNGLHRKDLARLFDACLIEHFHVPRKAAVRQEGDYPPLPLVLSLLDLTIDQDRPLMFEASRQGGKRKHWDRKRLTEARSAIEYLIFAVLNDHLHTVTHNWYDDLFEVLRRRCSNPVPRVISLNYDILLDNVLFRIAEDHQGRPEYSCDIRTDAYRSRTIRHGELFKLHGSMNWLYCACCRRLDIGMSDNGRHAVTCKVLNELYNQRPLDKHFSHAAPCPECGTPFRAVMIIPTRAKDYTNPHIQSIWYGAERALRTADRVCFIGYSLPDDDIEVIDLLRRGLGHLKGEAVTVVEYDQAGRSLKNHPVAADIDPCLATTFTGTPTASDLG